MKRDEKEANLKRSLVTAILVISVLAMFIAVAGATAHAPIGINGNSQFISANGVTSGNGTQDDPYIIENWDINAGTGTNAGIEIRDTDVYFIIRNCTIHDGYSNSTDGIYFYNVTNGGIEIVTSYNNSFGIALNYSSNNTITNCSVYNNPWVGIYLISSSNNNQITNCSVYSNSMSGIYLSSSSNNNITNCSVYSNSYSIALDASSNNNQITNCSVYNNTWVGIYLSSSSNNNQITNCSVYNNSDRGIALNYSSNNTITRCSVYNHPWDGIRLIAASNNNTITNCSVYNNTWVGILLISASNNNTITNCSVYNNSDRGIALDSSSNNNITSCSVYNNSFNIVLDASSNNNTITSCSVYNNPWVGIYLVSSSNNNITNCSVYSNSMSGIYLFSSSNNNITNCSVYNNPYGIAQDSSSNNEVHYCNIYDNTDYGVFSTGETVNATYNWWGDVSGPGRINRGIGVGFGTGNAVSANVDYDPWLDAPYLGGQPINFTYATTKTAPAGTTEIDAKAEADTNVSINTTAPVNVMIAEYSRNPGTGFGGDIGKYIDVHVNDTANVTNMTIRLFYTDADIGDVNENALRMRWWNAAIGAWIACSNTGVNTIDQNGYSGYIWAYIDKTTTPSLSDLEGAPFGGQWSPAPTPVPAFNAIGLLALIGILSAVLAVETSKKKSK